jgi:hypothetical protein
MDHTTATEPTGSIERAYAHFHRVLGTLLGELSSSAQVLWLEQEGHIIRPDYEHNEYRPAIYTVPDLAPWQEQLSELDRVQSEILEQTGRERPGKNLLPPLVADNVHYIRVSRYQGQTGRDVGREQVTARLEQLINTARQNLSVFENYATREDPARQQVENEVRTASKALERIQQSGVERFRETYRQTVIRPYVYFLDGTSTQLHLRNQGLLAAGPHVQTGWRQGPRKTRSDKITLPALAAVGNYAFYDLDAWEAARDSR